MTDRGRMLLRDFADLGATDATCFLGQWPYRVGAAADADRLRAYAARLGLRSVWVSHLASLFGFDTRTGNDATLAECAGDPLFRMFATIDPGQPAWRTELQWAASAGFHGIRVAPGFHRRQPAELRPVLDACEEHGLPLQFVLRLDDARVRHPLSPAVDPELHLVADLIRDRGELPLLLSGLKLAEWQELRRHLGDRVPRQVRLDLWHVNGPTHVVDQFGDDPDRWLFGSGFPVQTPEATALQLAASTLREDDVRAIVSGNAATLLAQGT
jgi:predicted TIM-barrel fold metal-dependent hydrolase